MPDENSVAAGGNQTSSPATSNQKSTVTSKRISPIRSDQINDDFVLDFGDSNIFDTEDTESSTPNLDNNSTTDSVKEEIEDTKNNEILLDNNEISDENVVDKIEKNENTVDTGENDSDDPLDNHTNNDIIDQSSSDLQEINEELDDISSTDEEKKSDFQLDLRNSNESLDNAENLEEVQDEEVQDEEVQDEEVQDEEVQDEEVQDEEVQDEEVQDGEVQDEEVQDEEVQDEEVQDEEVQDEEVQDEEVQDEEVQAEEVQDEEVQNQDNNNLEDVFSEKNVDFAENIDNELVDNQNTENNLSSIDFSENITNAEDGNGEDESQDTNIFKELNGSNEEIEKDNGGKIFSQDVENSSDSESLDKNLSNSEQESSQEDVQLGGTDNIGNMLNQNDRAQTNDILGGNDSSSESGSQSSDFDPFKIINQTETQPQEQPNIQDYLNKEPSNEVTQSSETQESSQSIDMINLDSNSSSESNNGGIVLDYPSSKMDSLNDNPNIPTTTTQENSLNQNNTEIGSGFVLNPTENNINTSTNVQETPNQTFVQENQFTTSLPSESGTSVPEINTIPTVQNIPGNEINPTQGEEITNKEPEVTQMQATLSLDQILDSELLSNPKYSDNTVVAPENTENKNTTPKSNKTGAIFIGIGIFVLAGIVAVLAFPSGNSERKPGDTIDTGNIVNNMENTGHYAPEDTGGDFPEPEFPDPEYPDINPDQSGDVTTSGIDENEIFTGLNVAPSNVEFPDPFGGIDDDERNDGLNETPKAIPYVGNTDDIIEEEPEENEENLINDILSSISSFKSQAESYYSYGQEVLDKKIIKFASQIISACDTYEEQVAAGEGISQDVLSEFEDAMLEIFSQIDNYNNGGSESPQIIQNNVVTNEEDNNFSEKEELRNYLYSR